MILDVSRALGAPGTEFPFLATQEVPAQDVLGEEVTFDKATISGFFSAAGDAIVLHGQLTTIARARCANCLAPAKAELQVPFREVFVREADPSDPDQFLFEGSRVDLSQMALALSVLALPMRFLCRADCQGANPGGAEEKDHCACQKELPAKHPFEALQQLLTKDEEV